MSSPTATPQQERLRNENSLVGAIGLQTTTTKLTSKPPPYGVSSAGINHYRDLQVDCLEYLCFVSLVENDSTNLPKLRYGIETTIKNIYKQCNDRTTGMTTNQPLPVWLLRGRQHAWLQLSGLRFDISILLPTTRGVIQKSQRPIKSVLVALHRKLTEINDTIINSNDANKYYHPNDNNETLESFVDCSNLSSSCCDDSKNEYQIINNLFLVLIAMTNFQEILRSFPREKQHISSRKTVIIRTLEQAINAYKQSLLKIFNNNNIPEELTSFLEFDYQQSEQQHKSIVEQLIMSVDDIFFPATVAKTDNSRTFSTNTFIYHNNKFHRRQYSFNHLQERTRSLLNKWSSQILDIPTLVAHGYRGIEVQKTTTVFLESDKDEIDILCDASSLKESAPCRNVEDKNNEEVLNPRHSTIITSNEDESRSTTPNDDGSETEDPDELEPWPKQNFARQEEESNTAVELTDKVAKRKALLRSKVLRKHSMLRRFNEKALTVDNVSETSFDICKNPRNNKFSILQCKVRPVKKIGLLGHLEAERQKFSSSSSCSSNDSSLVQEQVEPKRVHERSSVDLGSNKQGRFRNGSPTDNLNEKAARKKRTNDDNCDPRVLQSTKKKG